jgi:hypothetical protein
MKYLTLLLGVAVAFIAWRQWWVARTKLRLDLFDRRYKVYEATRDFLILIAKNPDVEHARFVEFAMATADAEFFFRSDVVEYLGQIRDRVRDMQAQQTLSHEATGDELSRRVKAEHDQRAWLEEQITAMTSVFAPYLSFAHVALSLRRFLARHKKKTAV